MAGESSVDLVKAMDLLAEQFGIRTLLLKDGDHINAALSEAGRIDELSLFLTASARRPSTYNARW